MAENCDMTWEISIALHSRFCNGLTANFAE